MVTIPAVVRLLGTTKPTAAKAIGVLEQLGLLRETTGRCRDRTSAMLDISTVYAPGPISRGD